MATVHARAEPALTVAFSGSAKPRTRLLPTVVWWCSLPPSQATIQFSLKCFDADDRAFGADDIARPLSPPNTQKNF
jgi:hypothetical protein